MHEYLCGNYFFDKAISTHYIVLAYKLILPQILEPTSKKQHAKYLWFDIHGISESLDVHQYTKIFLRFTRGDMKILHFFKTYYPDAYGGVQQVIYQLSEGAVEKGYEVAVLCLSSQHDGKEYPISNHKVYAAKENFYILSTGFSFSAMADFKRLADEADIIHYHFPWPYMDFMHLFLKPNKPSVVTYHSDIVKQKKILKLYQPVMMKFLNSVDAVVASSSNYALTSNVLSKLDNVEVIPLGLSRRDYKKASVDRIRKWRSKFGNRFFLFVGFLRYYKGLNYLIEAMHGLDYPLVIIGEGPCEQELKNQAESLGLRNIFFVGAVDDADKCAILEICYGVLFPSHLRSEAYGMTLIEASMYGKPMVSCEIGTGTSYINIHNLTGFVVPPESPHELRVAICKLWDNPQLAAEFGNNALCRYNDIFTADKMVNAYDVIYNRLIRKQ